MKDRERMIPSALRLARERASCSASAPGRALGFDPSVLYAYEAGARNISAPRLEALALYYKTRLVLLPEEAAEAMALWERATVGQDIHSWMNAVDWQRYPFDENTVLAANVLRTTGGAR